MPKTRKKRNESDVASELKARAERRPKVVNTLYQNFYYYLQWLRVYN